LFSKKSFRLFLFFYLFFTFCAQAQDAKTLSFFKAGNQAFAEKNYADAILNYKKASEMGVFSAELEYNIANAYAQNKQLGKAILHYERCLRINSYNADATQNLSVVNTWRKDEIEPISPFFGIRWAKAIRNALSSNTWTIIGLCCLFGAAFGTAVWLFGTTVLMKKRGFFAAIAAFLLAAIPFWCAYETLQLSKHSGFGIVQPIEIVMRTAPDAESSDIMTLHEGTRLELLDKIGDWLKIELPNGEQGWLPETAVEEI
jgi:tetratricopeptide (TPR) repeat protein